LGDESETEGDQPPGAIFGRGKVRCRVDNYYIGSDGYNFVYFYRLLQTWGLLLTAREPDKSIHHTLVFYDYNSKPKLAIGYQGEQAKRTLHGSNVGALDVVFELGDLILELIQRDKLILCVKTLDRVIR
jgi:hypothetical protein